MTVGRFGEERSGGLLHPLRGVDLSVCRGAELSEFAGRHQDAALEGADGLVVGLHGAVQVHDGRLDGLEFHTLIGDGDESKHTGFIERHAEAGSVFSLPQPRRVYAQRIVQTLEAGDCGWLQEASDANLFFALDKALSKFNSY